MAKFQIEAVQRTSYELWADDISNILKDTNKSLPPGFKIEYITNTETGKEYLVSSCNGCGKMLLDEDVDIVADDGDEYCHDCSDAIREDIKTHEVRCTNEDCGWSGMLNDIQKFHMKLYQRCPRCEEYKYLQDTKTHQQILLS